MAEEEKASVVDFVLAAQRLNRARKAVTDWMNAEGAAMRVRTNDQAPGWPEYEAAQADFDRLTAACGFGSPEDAGT